MSKLSEKIAQVIFRAVEERDSAVSRRVQIVFVGPPVKWLRDSFEDLKELCRIGNGQGTGLVFALVDTEDLGDQGSVSGVKFVKTKWDYVVSLRHPDRRLIIICDPIQWSSAIESVENSSELIGATRLSDHVGFRNVWRALEEDLSDRINLPRSESQQLITSICSTADRVEDDSWGWGAIDQLLNSETRNDAYHAAGLPCPETGSEAVVSCEKVLADLAKYCVLTGFDNASEAFIESGDLGRSKSESIGAMFQHLRETHGSSAEFDRKKIFAYADSDNRAWWEDLDRQTLASLLVAVVPSSGNENLKITIDNLAFAATATEPQVVRGNPNFSITSVSGEPITELEATRKITFEPPSIRLQFQTGTVIDSELPESHGRLAQYSFSAKDHRPLKIDVLPLDSFATRSYARVENAERNSAPSMTRRGQSVTQQIEVSTSGPHILRVYVANDISTVELNIRQATSSGESESSVLSADGPNAFRIRIDDVDTSAEYVLTAISGDQSKPEPAPTILEFLLEEPEIERPATRFASLIQAHQLGRKSLIAPGFTPTAATELSKSFLSEHRSWRGTSACLDGEERLEIDWNQDRAITGIRVQDDRRPYFALAAPPEPVLKARDSVRQLITADTGRIEDANLGLPEIQQAAIEYSKSYLEWLNTAPEYAVWMDCVALHAPVPSTSFAGSISPSIEPIAILLSPLHPARIAWHSNAQKLLSEHLTDDPTAAASLIDPHSSPSVVTLPLFDRTGYTTWQTFKSTRSLNPQWQLFINPSANIDAITSIAEQLKSLGFSPGTVSGSFSSTQAKRALNDGSEQLSARSNYSVALAGHPHASSMLERGVLESVAPDADLELHDRHDGMTIVDWRSKSTTPSLEDLGLAVESALMPVDWVNRADAADYTERKLDIVLLNELGNVQERISSSDRERFRSATYRGALIRQDIKIDINTEVWGSVISDEITSDNELENATGKLINGLESLLVDRNVDSYVVRPSSEIREVFSKMRSKFVAVTSTAVDPGSFMKLAKQIKKILWDFEMPVPSMGESGIGNAGGYYLLTEPDEVLQERLRQGSIGVGVEIDAADQVANGLLSDVQEIGIPILRKIGRSPAGSRGEIGLVLAIRALQGSQAVSLSPRLPIAEGDDIKNFLIPVDAFWPITRLFKQAGQRISDSHPDLLLIRIDTSEQDQTNITAIPIEVKFRSSPMSDHDIVVAINQARNLANILENSWNNPGSDLTKILGRHLLGLYVDHGFRMARHESDEVRWSEDHQNVIHEIASGEFSINVKNPGIVLAFDSSGVTKLSNVDGDTRFETLRFGEGDIKALLLGDPPTAESNQAFSRLLRDVIGIEPQAEDTHEAGTSPHTLDANSSSTSGSDPMPEELDPESDFSADDDEPDTVDSNEDGQEREAPSGSPNERQGTIGRRIAIAGRIDMEFEGFIGNEHAVNRVKLDLKRALMSNPPSLPRNYLLTGMPSTGKTELARRISEVLALPWIKLDGRAMTSRERLFDLIDGELEQRGIEVESSEMRAGLPVLEYPPLTVFIDEIHLAHRGVQESLLTTLEADDRSATLLDRIALVSETTFIFATTRISGLDAAFVSRCTEIELEEYSPEQVAEILQLRFDRDWPDQVFMNIARWSRSIPRVAISLARDLETSEDVAEFESGSRGEILELAESVRRMNRIDNNGLTRLHYQYLKVLADSGKPMGQQSISSLLSTVDPLRIEEDVEPFLIRKGLVKRMTNGRQITAEGRSYLAENSLES